jgi:hypothetical protein
MCTYENYKEAKLRIADIQAILENETDSYFEFGEEALVEERNELERFVNKVGIETGWTW